MDPNATGITPKGSVIEHSIPLKGKNDSKLQMND